MLYLKKYIGKSLLGIWKVEETCDELSSLLEHKDWLESVYKAKSESRWREMLAARVLLKELLGEEKRISYYKSGKPYLSDDSYKISISHTRGYVAVILHQTQTMGLDIEKQTDKIFKVKDRIITSSDYIDTGNAQTHLLLHWSAKEAMFKYLDAQGVDFRKNLHVESFIPKSCGTFRVSESKTIQKQSFDAYYMVEIDFVLVCLVSVREQ